jgi:putative thioredoxin
MTDHDLDVNLPEFQAAVLDESHTRPVVVDFWAPWCGPCKSLKPILEKLAAEYGGKFRLAKVNADDNQALSQQYGVRGIPAVKAFVNGEMVDEFSGALPEAEVRAFLDRLIPSQADELRAQAAAACAAGDHGAALQLLADASKLDPQHIGIRLDAAEIMLDLGEADEAQRLLGSVQDDADPRVPQLKARLQFLGAAGADEVALQARIAADGNDLDARLALANLAIAGQRYEDGMEQLLEIVRRDRGFQDDVGIRLDAAEIMLDLREAEEAQRLIGNMEDDADPRVPHLKARLQFLGAAGADEMALQARIAADANDLEARLALAKLAIAGQRYEDGMEQLLEIVRRDRGFQDDVGRTTLLTVFDLLGGGELVSRYRRLLASVLN